MSPKQIPWDVISESIGTVLPTNTYKFEIEVLEEAQSAKERYMLKGTYRVVEPRSEAGMVLYDYYALGTEHDPQADDPKSWEGIAAARFKDLIKKANVAQKPTVEETCASARGAQFIGDVTQEVDQADGPYKGTTRNRLKKLYRVGEKDAAQDGNLARPTASVSPFRPGKV
jgi:hypothetical protein